MFDFNPNKIYAQSARVAQLTKIKTSLNYLIKQCAEKLNYESMHINTCLWKINALKNTTPEIHYFHHALQLAMRMQDVNKSKEMLEAIIKLISDTNDSIQSISVSSISDTSWENFITKEAIKLTLADCGKVAEIHQVNVIDINNAKDAVSASLCKIARYDSNMFDEINEHVNIIKLFQGKITMGLTDVRMLGAMFIRLPRLNVDPVLYFLEHIVHEASHMHLNCLMSVDPCILNSSDERFVSPLRSDLRPMLGVFHATFVSARVARTMINLYQQVEDENLVQIIAESLDEVIRGLGEIERHAKLTECGNELLQGMKTILEIGMNLSVWADYSFSNDRVHRFGSGLTKTSNLKRLVV